jgi:hypothetical protein
VRLVALVVCILAVCTSAAAAVATTYTAKATTKCLMSHHVLVSPQSKAQVLPLKLPAVAAIQVSFAFIPSQALDHGYVVFERDPAIASRVATAWFNYDLKQASKVKGVDLSKVRITLKDVFTVRGNSITVWQNQPVKAASRRLTTLCLR